MKPFIKPRTVTPPAGPAPQERVTPNELAVVAVAAAITEPTERAAYLDRVCAGDAALRARLEKRLAERQNASVPATVSPAELMPLHGRGQGGAVALVPMPGMQMTPANQPPLKQSAFPWMLSTFLAAAVGALVVIFSIERNARTVAEGQAHTSQTAAATAAAERDSAAARALEAQTVAARAEEKMKQAEQRSTAAEAQRAAAAAESAKALAAEKQMQAAADLAKTKLEESQKQVAQLTATQQAERIAWAGTLGKYASALVEQGKHTEAETPARQALQFQEALNANSWATHDARYVLGAALMGKGDLPNAEKELTAAVAGMEALLPQAADPGKARYAAAVKKLAQLYSSTGRKREASELRHKLDSSR